MVRLLLLPLLLLPLAAHSGLDDELSTMFDSMLNVTEANAHWGQRRGSLSGGSVYLRNRIVEGDVVSMVPPSYEAGCGGIDMYAGSFSFSGEQLTQLFRSVASNAASYAFKVALDSMCQNCGQVMESIQDKIQALNSLFSNSCQLGQGIVNDAISAFDAQQRIKTSGVSLREGIGDVFESWTTSTGQSPTEQVQRNAPSVARTELQGNLVWRALKGQDVRGWFRHGDDDLLEVMMSLTGTVIVGEPTDAPDGHGVNNEIIRVPRLISVADLLYGSDTASTKVYRCRPSRSEDSCIRPDPEDRRVLGMMGRVEDILFGSGGNTGLIAKARHDVEPTDDEQAFMEFSAGGGIGAGISTLARRDQGMAEAFARQAAPIIALAMIEDLVRQLQFAVTAASATSTSAYAGELRRQLADARAEIRDEYAVLAQRHGTMRELVQDLESRIRLAKQKTYVGRIGAAAIGGRGIEGAE